MSEATEQVISGLEGVLACESSIAYIDGSIPELSFRGYHIDDIAQTLSFEHHTHLLAPHLDKGEGSLGVHVNISHQAATPPGLTVTVNAECTNVRGPRVSFHIRAHDGVDLIGEGEHERFIVKWDRFNARVDEKRTQAAA